MKPSSKSPRTPSRLSDSVHHQLNMYALAASATAVGVLALAQPAEARVVYTKAHRVIGPNGNFWFSIINGQTDLIFSAEFSATSFSWGNLRVEPRSGNFLGHYGSRFGWYAAALPAGYSVSGHDKSNSFNGNNNAGLMAGFACCSSGGDWFNVKNRYLGLEFRTKGELHFGWARLNVRCFKGFGCTGLLTGYAYETIPNKPIIAGKTKGPDVIALPLDTEAGTLGHLALGRR